MCVGKTALWAACSGCNFPHIDIFVYSSSGVTVLFYFMLSDKLVDILFYLIIKKKNKCMYLGIWKCFYTVECAHS